jgi:hypothetical protein
MRVAGVAMGATLAVALTVCGAGGAGAGGTKTPIAARVLAKNELPGFIGTSENTFQFHTRGFVAGLNENLTGLSGYGGESVVAQFKSAGEARSEVKSQLKSSKKIDNTGFETFAVPQIPGAVGFGNWGGGYSAAINVLFAKGDYYYLVGDQVGATKSSINSASEDTLIAAALHLYHRVSP